MDAGIDCVAITDHNGGAWVDVLTAAYAKMKEAGDATFRPLHLFPGVELSVNGGFHVLALFDATVSTADIDSLLGKVDYVGTKGDANGVTQKSITEVIKSIADAGGIAIPAHVDQDKGLLRVQPADVGKCFGDPLTIRQVLDRPEVFAKELVDRNAPLPQIYAERNPRWTSVIGTDVHGSQHGPQPGSRFTWVKMGTPSLEGLRLALLDGAPLSIQRSDEADGEPNRHAAVVLDDITIRTARYAGRGNPLVVEFSPWLTTIIGGRGSGKSTVLEMLRLALRRADEMPADLREQFERFARVPESRDDYGALQNETEVVVGVRKDGARFRLRWRQDGQGTVIEEQGNGNWIEASGNVPSRFPVRIFSQKQVSALADDPNALLSLIDEAPEVNRAEWGQQWKETEARFLRLRSESRELHARVADSSRLEGQLADARRQLAVFEEGGHREVLVKYQRSSRQRRAFGERTDELTRSQAQLREAASALAPADVSEEGFDAADAAEGSALSLLREAADKQRQLANQLVEAAESLSQFQREWLARRDASEWAERSKEITEQYQGLVDRLQQEGIKDPTGYGALVQRVQTLERQLADMVTTRTRIANLDVRAKTELDALEAMRVDLSDRRSAFLGTVLTNNEFVRMQVVPLGDDAATAESSFRTHLAREDGRLTDDILSEDRKRGVLVDLYSSLPAGNPRTPEICRRVGAIKHTVVAGASGADLQGRTEWFRKHVRALRPEQLDRLQLWWPEDTLKVQYRRPGNDQFMSIEQGSPGQKSAAVLAFLLSHGNEPIVLDQPEDDLDNHLIYDLIVHQIRQGKRQRQVIVVTHNPNIVVNGDAEMVIAMDYRGGQCVVLGSGTGCLQNWGVRQEICRVMEGGARAFEDRYRRIHLVAENRDV
jgi:energy-coupling factor transporter ATP-binding protein EcfA2